MTIHRSSVHGAVRGVGAVVLTATVAGLVACSGADDSIPDNDFTYVVDQPLRTTNAASSLGVATGAAKLSARLYPGAYLPGPGGRLLPNTDLVSAVPAPDNPDAVDYSIADTATYSDGAPVVCDDFLLTWVAAERTDLFAADLGLMTRVRNVDCAAGQREFRVEFDPGQGARFRELFGPGEIMPSHVVAQNAGVDSVVDAVDTGDEDALTALGRAWSSTFDLAATDPTTVPTYGPYRIEERRDDGSLLLSGNPGWKGDRPGLDRIVVRGGGDLGTALDGTADVTDAAVRPDQPTDAELTEAGLTVSREPGVRVDGLTLSDSGVFATDAARRSFASCIDRTAVVGAVAKSTGAEVDPVVLRVANPGSPAAEALKDTAARIGARDPEATRASLDGVTVRIGYPADGARYASIVDALVASCGEGGVTVVGVPLDTTALQTPDALGTEYDALLDTRTSYARNPQVSASPASRVGQIGAAEDTLADQARTIPLSVEPRLVVTAASVSDVSDSGTDSGLSWNMDRWTSTDHPVSERPDPADGPTEENA